VHLFGFITKKRTLFFEVRTELSHVFSRKFFFKSFTKLPSLRFMSLWEKRHNSKL